MLINSGLEAKFHQTADLQELADLLQLVLETKIEKRLNVEVDLSITPDLLMYYATTHDEIYKTFEIRKKSGKASRTISSPDQKLKVIQRCINELLMAVFNPTERSFGFLPGRSVADNARLHVNKKYVYNIDLKDFFPSISFRRVKATLELEPFNLNNFREPIAFYLANICCKKSFETVNGFKLMTANLAQGAPTSPMLSNIVCQKLDHELFSFASTLNCEFSRYADDLTFSSNKNIFNKWFKRRLIYIIQNQCGFQINWDKERLQHKEIRQEVTGIVVNKKVNVPRYYIKDIRFWLNRLERNGHDESCSLFDKLFPHKKSAAKHKGRFISLYYHLHGKIQYLKVVRGGDDEIYRNLKFRLKEIIKQNKISIYFPRPNSIENQESLFDDSFLF